MRASIVIVSKQSYKIVSTSNPVGNEVNLPAV